MQKLSVCQFLITNNGSLYCVNHLGNYPLHKAYRITGFKPKIHENLVKLLQQIRACPTIQNNARYIPRQPCCNTEVSNLSINEFISILNKQSCRNKKILPQIQELTISQLLYCKRISKR